MTDIDPFAEPGAATDAPIVEHDDQILYGSNNFPATFEIDGETVALGAIVAAAFAASALTEDQWNALPDTDRDAKIQAELDRRGYVAPTDEADAAEDPAPVVDPVGDREIVGSGADAPTHDTDHDAGLSDRDARVAGDAAPLVDPTVTVEDPKNPLGTMPDTATATATVTQPLTINTDLSDQPDTTEKSLGDAVIPTKPGGADLEDVLDDETKDVLSRAPARAHDGLVNQLDLKWSELKHFVATVTGEIDGELGDVLAFVRSYL